MHVLVWVATGFLAGWLARVVMKGRTIGFLGDVTLGVLGSVTGAWLLKGVGGGIPAAGSVAHLAMATIGAMTLVGVARLILRAAEGARHYGTEFARTRSASDLEGRLSRLTQLERRILDAVLRREPVSRDPDQAYVARLTIGERLADRTAAFGGSWRFLGLFTAFMLGWMFLNATGPRAFDPYPFILLNLVLSCLAAIQAPVIMMSQNRQAAKDRLDARQDYQVNLKAELEVMALHTKLDELRERHWQRLLDLQEQQMELLGRIERGLGGAHGRARG